MKRFRNTFAGKLCVLLVVIICLPVLLIGLYSAARVQNVIWENDQTRSQTNLRSIANSFNIFFEKYKTITDLILVSDTIRDLALVDTDDRTVIFNNDRRFSAEIQKLSVNALDLRDVFFLAANGREYFTSNNTHMPMIREKVAAFYARIQPSQYAVIGYDGFFSYEPLSSKEQYYVLILRALYSYTDRRFLGTVVLEFQPQIFANLLAYTDDRTLITDSEGLIVYDAQNELQHHALEELNASDSSAMSQPSIAIASTDYGFSLAQFVDSSPFNKSVQIIQYQFLGIATACILFFAIIAVLLSRRLVHPLKQLETAMKQMETGDLSQHVSITTHDEFAQLGDIYNHMLDRLNLYIDRAYGEELRRLDAEYRALQAQINPHFLYNALETINSMAQINHEPEISNMVCALATMFRYTTVQHENLVPVAMELKHVHNYLEVQRPSYDDQVIYEEDVPVALLGLPIPKLILQPIVENCFNHGFDTAKAAFHIRLKAYRQDDALFFEISDDGMGMHAKKLRALHEALAKPLNLQTEMTSIGLSNIHNRLRMTFGADSGIASITSTLGGGTTITLVIHQADREAQHNDCLNESNDK